MKNYGFMHYGIDCGKSYSECSAFVEAINHETSLNCENAIPMVIEITSYKHWIISPLYEKDIKRLQEIYKQITEE